MLSNHNFFCLICKGYWVRHCDTTDNVDKNIFRFWTSLLAMNIFSRNLYSQTIDNDVDNKYGICGTEQQSQVIQHNLTQREYSAVRLLNLH